MPVITKPPKSNAWKLKPNPIEGLYPGLEHLQGMDSIFMKQRIDTLEVLTGWQVKNKWKLADPVTGEMIAAFKEESDCCERQCCKNARSFKADITDSQGNVLFKMDRPWHCACMLGSFKIQQSGWNCLIMLKSPSNGYKQQVRHV